MTHGAGIVRTARRPPGWRAPGPPPATPPDRPDLWPRAGEDLCWLSGDWRILQRVGGHRWSLDDLVTAWFAAREVAAAPPVRLVDLGCGIGTVLLLLGWRFPTTRGAGIEAQAVSVELARRSIAWNGADDRLAVRHGDLRDPAALSDVGPVELVTGTPPYLRPGTATESAREQWGPCHVEHRGGIEAYAAAAARLLAPGAPFVACEQTAQWERVAVAAARAGLGVARRMDVVPRDGKAALFSVFALRAGATAPCVEPPLVVRDRAGRRTAAFTAIRAEMGLPP
ncbi:MAG: methyltransferase [Candidatus Binatia bacterium]